MIKLNQLIKVEVNDNQVQVLSARDLHEFLQVGTKFADWFPRMCEYGFSAGTDFNFLKNERVQYEGARQVTRTIDDALITVEMAKEICMLQRNERGKEARQYFIKLEKDWNSPEKVMARALRIAEMKLSNLELETAQQKQIINELQPKATYYDLVLQNKSLLSISKIAKDYGMSGKGMNKLLHELGVQYKQGDCWLLYQKYADKGFTQSKTHVIDDERSRLNTHWTQKGRLFIYDLLKREANLLPLIEREGETHC